jgi:hypothetical protein
MQNIDCIANLRLGTNKGLIVHIYEGERMIFPAHASQMRKCANVQLSVPTSIASVVHSRTELGIWCKPNNPSQIMCCF